MRYLEVNIVQNNNIECVQIIEQGVREFLNPVPECDKEKSDTEKKQRWIDKYDELFPEQ